MMKVMKVTKEYFETEDEKVYFFEPLKRIIPRRKIQKMIENSGIMIESLKNKSKDEHIHLNIIGR